MSGEAAKAPLALGPFRPVNEEIIAQQAKVTLSERKRKYLSAFTGHYCSKNSKSKEYASKYRGIYADQRAVSFFHLSLKELCFPLVFKRGLGSKVWDIDGNEYIDIALDFGISLFGHQPDFLKEALTAQLNEGWALSMRPEKSALAAELLCRLAGTDRAVFCQSGTEAVMTAVRIARHVSKKKKVVIFSNSYHGHSDGLLAFNMRAGGRDVPKPVTAGTTQGAVEDLIILEYGNPETLEVIRSMRHELAAVVAEPVQSRGIRINPEDFLRDVRKITAESGTALIFDEMITGFRVAPAGVQEYLDIRPDISAYGKIIGGGISLGAIAGKAVYLNAIDGGLWGYGDNSYPKDERTFFAGTHCQNTLAMAAAHAVLSHLLEQGPGLQKRLNKTCTDMCSGINEVLEREDLPFRVFNFGSLFRFEALERLLPIDLNLFLYHLRDNGVMVSEVGNNFLSAAHTLEDIENIIQAVSGSVQAMKAGGYFL